MSTATDEKVDDLTARDIIDSVTCSLVGCERTARWVTQHECGNVIYACTIHHDQDVAHRRMHDRRGETCSGANDSLCAQCSERWPIPFAIDSWTRI